MTIFLCIVAIENFELLILTIIAVDNVCMHYFHFTFSLCLIANDFYGMHYAYFAIDNHCIELLKLKTSKCTIKMLLDSCK